MKKLIALSLAFLLCTGLIFSASADAWFPAADEVNEHLEQSVYHDGDCYALNVFLSNYAETQLDYYEVGSGAGSAYKALLKHFELNPTAYKEGIVTSFTGSDGKTYMKVDADKFEDRMEDLFCEDIDAENFSDYQDGYMVVSAENFGAPLKVYASATSCYIMSPNLYIVYFDIYRYDGNVSKMYSIANDNLPSDHGELIAEGSALFRYEGSVNDTNFYPYSFTLYQYQIFDRYSATPYGNENLPYTGNLNDSPTVTAEVPTTEEILTTEEISVTFDDSLVLTEESEDFDIALPPIVEASTKADLEPVKEGIMLRLTDVLIILVLVIVVMSIISVVVILVFFRPKKPLK